jgi:hypothetical protein
MTSDMSTSFLNNSLAPQPSVAPPQPAVELRAIRSKEILVGYFDDPAIFEAHARRLNNAGFHIYSPINPSGRRSSD